MTSNSSRDYLRDFTAKVATIGWRFDGHDGRGHARYIHDELGIHTSAPSTPSDWRSERNTLARFERLAGRRVPRQKSGHHTHVRAAVSDFRPSANERRCADLIDRALTEADLIRTRLADIAANPNPSQVAEARTLIARHNELRNALALLHRHIDPLTLP